MILRMFRVWNRESKDDDTIILLETSLKMNVVNFGSRGWSLEKEQPPREGQFTLNILKTLQHSMHSMLISCL